MFKGEKETQKNNENNKKILRIKMIFIEGDYGKNREK